MARAEALGIASIGQASALPVGAASGNPPGGRARRCAGPTRALLQQALLQNGNGLELPQAKRGAVPRSGGEPP
jgi:hypothetical protein